MKKLLLPVFLLLVYSTSRAQLPPSDSSLVKWSYSGHKVNDSLFEVEMKADIASGWRLFSPANAEDMPRASATLDSASQALARIVDVLPGNGQITSHEALLDADISYFELTGIIRIRLAITSAADDIYGNLSYMTYKGENFSSPELVSFRLHASGAGNYTVSSGALAEQSEASAALKRPAIDLQNPVNRCGGTGAEDNAGSSLWKIFALGFVGGLVGLFMPCTFPMIPLTVSFFTKQSADRRKAVSNASLYGFFIFLIYVLLSLPFYFLDAGSSAILNNISTNAWLNLFFALVFFLFALSFFGLFEITLPGGLANRVGTKSGVSSFGGIFFMALTLAIVSFSCTGPILGSLLVGALNQDGGAVQLTVAMAGFGLALGLPFALFALFPRWLHSLPRSGSWMTTLKIVFGFVELALMIKFLSNADLVMHWGILKREVFFGLWVLLSLATGLYLFGIIKFKHDPPPAKISAGRKIAGTLFLAFAVYLAPGLTNTHWANRALISGFPPPLTYSLYGHDTGEEKGVEADIVNDYDKALARARAEHKPLLIDFTGWACVNCRKMEENVWTDTSVSHLIRGNFVLVSLYVDDRAQLKKNEQFLFTGSDGSKKTIETIGDKFGTLQAVNFGNASQPLYAIISPDEQLLNLPVGYTPDISEYRNWLQCGLDAYRQVARP